jgi:hypothetical protein
MPGVYPVDRKFYALPKVDRPATQQHWVSAPARPRNQPVLTPGQANNALLGRHRQRAFQMLGQHRQLTYQQIAAQLQQAGQEFSNPNATVYQLRYQEYILEKLDPKHRPARGLSIIWDFYLHYQCHTYQLELNAEYYGDEYKKYGTLKVSPSPYFFTWVDSIVSRGGIWLCVLLYYAYWYCWQVERAKGDPTWQPGNNEWGEFNNTLSHWPDVNAEGIKFFTGIQSLPYRVWRTTDGRLGWNYNPLTGQGDLLDTGAGSTAWGTTGFIYVLAEDKYFYTTPQEIGRLHHSSLSAGRGVLAAGEWSVQQGELKVITAQTGHYRLPMKSLLTAIDHITLRLNVMADTYNVKLFQKSNGLQPTLVKARDFYHAYKRNAAQMEAIYQVFGR